MCGSGALGTPLVFEGNFSQDKFLDLPAGQLAAVQHRGPRRPAFGDRHPPGRPGHRDLRPSHGGVGPARTHATTFENGDTLTVTLGFENGRTALITAVLTTPFAGRVTVLGSKAWVEIRDRSHPEHPQGWDVTTVAAERAGHGLLPAAPERAGEYRGVRPRRRGEADYPVPWTRCSRTSTPSRRSPVPPFPDAWNRLDDPGKRRAARLVRRRGPLPEAGRTRVRRQRPPDTSSTTPVTYDDAGESNHTTDSATSAAEPGRPIG